MKLLAITTFILLAVNLHAQCWQKIDAFGSHTVAIKTDGTLWTWGRNEFGQLGNGSNNATQNTPNQIGDLDGWLEVEAGFYFTIAIKMDGTMWAWGRNNYGQLGDGSFLDTNVPIQIGNSTGWKQAAGGGNHAVAIKNDGTLWAWGANINGQLGDGTNIDRHTPVQIGSETDWEKVEGSYHSLAIKENGTLWAWGYNVDGQLGDGTNLSQNAPKQVSTLTNWELVKAGVAHSIAIRTDSTLWTWGNNSYGQLGNGTTENSNSPEQIACFLDSFNGVSPPNENLKIFPSPSQDFIIINILNTELVGWRGELRDGLGQTIAIFPKVINNLKIELHGISAGVYFFTIKGEAGQITKRFIKILFAEQ